MLGLDFPTVCQSCKPHPSQMRLVRPIIHLEECWKKNSEYSKKILSHWLKPSHKFQHVTYAITPFVCVHLVWMFTKHW